MLFSSLFADDDQDGETPDESSSLFDALRDLTSGDDGSVPADDVRRHFVQSGMFSFTRPMVSDHVQEAGVAAEQQHDLGFKGFRKQRKPVTTTCGRCGVGGHIIKNHGGATRETVNHPAKYKMECQAMFGGCGRRFLFNRDPNPDGSHTQVESKFTIPGEVKVRPDYKCGVCGMIKVRGHKSVCTGKRPADAMSDAGAVLKRAKTLLGEGYGPDTADAEDDDGAVLPELSSSAPFSMLASVVASKQPAPVPSAAPAVAPFTPAVATAVAPTVAPPVTAVVPTVATGSLPASKEEDEDEEDEHEGNADTLFSIARSTLINHAVQVRNGNAAISLLKLKKYKVKGDGSCWVYAMLACAGLCQSRSLTAEQTPTPRDRGMDRLCREFAYLWLFDHRQVLLRDEIETLDEIIDKLPQHPMVDPDDFGSFGTINTIMGLAAYLDVSVVCWNKTTLRNSEAQQQVIMHMHDSTDGEIKETSMTPGEIVAFSQKEPRVMHIEWNGLNHYAALIGSSDVPIKQTVHTALMLATPVADVNPKSLTVAKPLMKKMGNVSGWMHLVDLYRSDLTLNVVPEEARKKPLKPLLELARTKNYHGVIYYAGPQHSDVVCYVKFSHDAKLTPSDFLKCGDFSSHIYIDKTWMEAATTTIPPDPHTDNCPCHTIYTRSMEVVDCLGCKKSFHAKCVGLADASKAGEWRCLGCAK